MIRTILVVGVLFIAVLFLPLWLQLVLFFMAVWVMPHRLFALVPAVFADVLYSPTGHLSLLTLKLTIVVGVLLVIRWLLLTQTRFSSVLYGMEI